MGSDRQRVRRFRRRNAQLRTVRPRRLYRNAKRGRGRLADDPGLLSSCRGLLVGLYAFNRRVRQLVRLRLSRYPQRRDERDGYAFAGQRRAARRLRNGRSDASERASGESYVAARRLLYARNDRERVRDDRGQRRLDRLRFRRRRHRFRVVQRRRRRLLCHIALGRDRPRPSDDGLFRARRNGDQLRLSPVLFLLRAVRLRRDPRRFNVDDAPAERRGRQSRGRSRDGSSHGSGFGPRRMELLQRRDSVRRWRVVDRDGVSRRQRSARGRLDRGARSVCDRDAVGLAERRWNLPHLSGRRDDGRRDRLLSALRLGGRGLRLRVS